ncbi:MAG: alpha/beta fold hydrolase [Pseudomonadota bacterium]
MRTYADPVIFIPGITATYLQDKYPLPPDTVWSVLKKNYERATLHPNNLKFEAKQPALVEPGQLFEIAYEDLIEELRVQLAPGKGRPDHECPVYPFGYDWRKPLSDTVAQLDDFIDGVIQRTRLQRSYHDDGYDGRVNLVGHSMGGLIIAGLIAKGETKARKVNRIVTMATPYQGSYESVLKITTGLGVVGGEEPKARERWAARLTPALYHLLPSFEDALQAPSGFPSHFFDRKAWQPSVETTIDAFIKQVAVRPVRARTLFNKLLSSAKGYLDAAVHELDLAYVGFHPDRWLCILGVDAKTMVRLKASKNGDAIRYDLTSKDRLNSWKRRNTSPEKWVNTGDGTVPYKGAVPPFLDLKSIVCITPDDYGTWELKDKVLSGTIGGFHGIMPNMNMLHRMITCFLKPFDGEGRPPSPNYIWGRPAPDLPDRDTAWDPPFQSLRRKKD